MTTQTALITGGSAGLGRALAIELHSSGWQVVVDGRRPSALADLPDEIVAVAGDVTDPAHRAELVDRVASLGRLDLLVHNASTPGPLPMGELAASSPADLEAVWATNVAAPLALTTALLPLLSASTGTLLSISSDAAVNHYETWGLYGATKAALDHLTLTVGAETGLAAYAVDPGDMRTQMHADAFPGDDISDRPLPQTVVPALLRLLSSRPASGRYRAEEL